MYRRGDTYITKPGRTYFFITYPGTPEGKFYKATETYCNALINSNGGILVFGVDPAARVVGFDLSRAEEDLFKLNFDNVIKQMRPTIHPHQYRLDVIYLKQYLALFEIRMSAGEPQEIYENSKREMYIVREKQLYGPLIPCEITQIVYAKYKDELSALKEIYQTTDQCSTQITSEPSQTKNEKVDQEKCSSKEINEEATQTAKKTKIERIKYP